MSPLRIVSVFGATGSAVIRGLLEDGTFTPRAITRNPDSERSLKLKAQGVEVVKGDTLDKDSLVAALRGSEAVFGITVPIHPVKAEGEGPNEIVQGKNMVDAAKEVGVKFFIFSSGPDISKLTGGKYKNLLVTEQKLVVDEYLKSSGLPHTSLLPGTFLENFWKCIWRPAETAKGFDIAVPIFSPTDTNSFTWIGRDYPATVLALLKNYEDPSKNILGRSYQVVNASITYPEVAAMASKALGVEVTFTSLPTSGVAYRDEIFKCLVEYGGLYTARHPDLVALGVEFRSVQEFMDTELKSRFG
ncbi:NAD(P)-binding protein [Mycena alexandri]|uniref:NAD(P)-binding protein n=1 Tax=Mycena alexandri TaxID=1745969 RepID=A0AAD6S2W2_9AGAR|nr:NAD(P)-binding protein [Mycena alexandri]